MLFPQLAYVALYLEDIPNGIFVCMAACIGCFLALVSLRTVYAYAQNPRTWIHEETARAIYGVYVMRVVAFLACICTMILLGRIGDEMIRSMWSPMSLNKENWNIARIVACALLPICACLMHTNPLFRIYLALVFPALAVLDMYSELDLIAFVTCIDSSLCTQTNMRASLLLWAIRDLVSLAINTMGTCLAWYLWAWIGFFDNEIYFPPYEHRVLSFQIGKTFRRRHNVKRKLGDGDFLI